MLAIVWCNEGSFRDWLKIEFKSYANMDLGTPEGAANFIKKYCRIRSRRELMFNGDAIEIFNRDIREPYMYWIKRNETAHA